MRSCNCSDNKGRRRKKKQSSVCLAAQAGRRLARPWLRSQWWASPRLSPPSHSLCCALPFSPAPEWQAGGRGQAAAMMAKSLHLLLRAAASTSKAASQVGRACRETQTGGFSTFTCFTPSAIQIFGFPKIYCDWLKCSHFT